MTSKLLNLIVILQVIQYIIIFITCSVLVKYHNVSVNICTTYYNNLAVSLLVILTIIHFLTFTLQFSFQEKKHSNPSQELKSVQCSPISKMISDSSKFTRKEDFFIFTKEQDKVDPR